MTDTHQVFNQSTPLVDVYLYQANPSLYEALTALAAGNGATQVTLNILSQRTTALVKASTKQSSTPSITSS